MITVRAKMKCTQVTHFETNSQVKLTVAYGPDNKDFTDATPSGEITMSISKGKPAADLFTPGKTFFVDFTPA